MSANNDMARAAEAIAKLESSNPDYDHDIAEVAKTLIRETVVLFTSQTHANGSNAIAANAAPSQWRAPSNGRVVQAHFVPTAAATENSSNNAQISTYLLYANGWQNRALATRSTAPVANGGTGTLAPGVDVALTVTDKANARFTQADVLAPKVAMNASGVALAVGSIVMVIEREGPVNEAK